MLDDASWCFFKTNFANTERYGNSTIPSLQRMLDVHEKERNDMLNLWFIILFYTSEICYAFISISYHCEFITPLLLLLLCTLGWVTSTVFRFFCGSQLGKYIYTWMGYLYSIQVLLWVMTGKIYIYLDGPTKLRVNK